MASKQVKEGKNPKIKQAKTDIKTSTFAASAAPSRIKRVKQHGKALKWMTTLGFDLLF